MSLKQMAREYASKDNQLSGIFCRSCSQRRGDPSSHFIAGARAFLEYARGKAFDCEEYKGIVKLSDLVDWLEGEEK